MRNDTSVYLSVPIFGGAFLDGGKKMGTFACQCLEAQQH